LYAFTQYLSSLPSHVGYTQLCIILEKQKFFDEVIRLAQETKKKKNKVGMEIGINELDDVRKKVIQIKNIFFMSYFLGSNSLIKKTQLITVKNVNPVAIAKTIRFVCLVIAGT
jgi:hypothetical protein